MQDLGELPYFQADLMAEIMLNYGKKDENDCDEVVALMIRVGGYSRNPIKLDIDLKKWET